MKRAAVALTVVLISAGCGGLLPSAKATPPPERSTVRIGTVGELRAFIHLPLTLADRLGYFAANGIKVEFSTATSGLDAVAALGRGSVDLVNVPYEFTIRAQAAGTRLKMVTLLLVRPGLMLTVGKPFFGQVNSMKDLVGKPVGVTAPGTQTETLVRLLALREGLDPASIRVKAIGVGRKNQSAIASGQVAAGVDVDPFATEMEEDGTGLAVELVEEVQQQQPQQRHLPSGIVEL